MPLYFYSDYKFYSEMSQKEGLHQFNWYLDDFLVTGKTLEECAQAQCTLISILRSLGLYVAWQKCASPSQHITYLGVRFDTISMTITLPIEKLDKLHNELEFFSNKLRATKIQLQRLCGIVTHCSKVIRGGHTFSRCMMDMLKNLPEGNKRVRLNQDFRHDLTWWQQCASIFNGTTIMIQDNVGQAPYFHTDASLNGYGLWSNTDWQAGYFNTSVKPKGLHDNKHYHWMNVCVEDQSYSSNINVLEIIPVWLGLLRWAHGGEMLT